MSNHLLRLLKIQLLYPFYRIRYDFIKETGVLFSGGIVLLLVSYLVHDFFTEQLYIVPLQVIELAKKVFFGLLSMVFFIFSIKKIGPGQITKGSLQNLAKRLGESKSSIFYLNTFQILGGSIIFYLLPLAIANHLLGHLSISFIIKCCGLTTLGIIPLYIVNRIKLGRAAQTSRIQFRSTGGRLSALAKWRIFQMNHYRGEVGISLLIGYLGCLPLAALNLNWPLPELIYFAAFLFGLFMAFGLCFQFAKDLEFRWYENQVGIDQKIVVGAYRILAIQIYLIPLLLAIALHFIFFWNGRYPLNIGIKTIIFYLLPSLLTPSLMAQVDPRKPWIQCFIIALLTFFIASGFMMTWFCLLLVPLVDYYGLKMNQDRFSRS